MKATSKGSPPERVVTELEAYAWVAIKRTVFGKAIIGSYDTPAPLKVSLTDRRLALRGTYEKKSGIRILYLLPIYFLRKTCTARADLALSELIDVRKGGRLLRFRPHGDIHRSFPRARGVIVYLHLDGATKAPFEELLERLRARAPPAGELGHVSLESGRR